MNDIVLVSKKESAKSFVFVEERCGTTRFKVFRVGWGVKTPVGDTCVHYVILRDGPFERPPVPRPLRLY